MANEAALNLFHELSDVPPFVPTDPVVMRAAYAPGLNGSPLGAATSAVIRRLYSKNNKAPNLLPPEEDGRSYEAMVEDMKNWRE